RCAVAAGVLLTRGGRTRGTAGAVVRGDGHSMSLTVCLAPANTIGYPQGGGHLWVYLNWALALRAVGCAGIWLEGLDGDVGDHSVARRRRWRSRAVRERGAALT